MDLKEKVDQIQAQIAAHGADGWLLYDNHGSNRFVRELLEIPSQCVLTRRYFYWIPKEGEPVKILHQIEAENLNHLPGKQELYLSWLELEQKLKELLKGKVSTVLMEYSPRGANPYVATVDAGTIEVIRGFGVEVATSADLLQLFTSVLTEQQIISHHEAAQVLEHIIARVWDRITTKLHKEESINEYEVQKFILSEFTAHDCITEDGPICAVNGHSAMPHYMATKKSAQEIRRGDFLLVDLWCKKNVSHGVYADITRVAVVAPQPTPKQQEIFEIVKGAQLAGIEFVRTQIQKGAVIRGAEVDDVCRSYIKQKGYGAYFTHRTGHNIDTQVHGAGVHLDNLETSDSRKIWPGMCFSIEPGIYLPTQFGVRLESNLVIGLDRRVEVTGGLEESMVCLL